MFSAQILHNQYHPIQTKGDTMYQPDFELKYNPGGKGGTRSSLTTCNTKKILGPNKYNAVSEDRVKIFLPPF